MPDLSGEPLFISFRDPAGSLVLTRTAARRTVKSAHAGELLTFLSSPLALRRVQAGELIESEVVDSDSSSAEISLRHPLVAFPSYPWEWPPLLWRRAAELTLSLCAELVGEGWILKDATPLNLLFRGCKPVFVDILSVEKRDPASSLWLAYGQFVRTFLLPLLAGRSLGWPLSATITRRDGYEPEELHEGLSWLARWQQPARSLITFPVFLDRRMKPKLDGNRLPVKWQPGEEVSAAVLIKTFKRLQRQLHQVMPPARTTAWTNYVSTSNHYSPSDMAAKTEWVGRLLEEIKPRRVLDVGCNTGAFSRLAAQKGCDVVAIDADMHAVEALADASSKENLTILPLVVDLARPTPAAGWEYRESRSFLDRAEGYFDVVMMLAVIHHLLLQAQIPLGHIAALCHRLARNGLLVEWVPSTDIKFQELLRGREAFYGHLDENAFLEAFGAWFLPGKALRLENGRTLHWMERR